MIMSAYSLFFKQNTTFQKKHTHTYENGPFFMNVCSSLYLIYVYLSFCFLLFFSKDISSLSVISFILLVYGVVPGEGIGDCDLSA